jgi:hypothetical protein
MRRLLTALLPLFPGACAPAMAQEPPVLVPAPGFGTAQIVLSGDYVGKQLRITLNNRVVVDRRFSAAPPASGDRVPIFTTAMYYRVQVEIEGCPTAVVVRVDLEPAMSSSLIFDGCSVRARLPE